MTASTGIEQPLVFYGSLRPLWPIHFQSGHMPGEPGAWRRADGVEIAFFTAPFEGDLEHLCGIIADQLDRDDCDWIKTGGTRFTFDLGRLRRMWPWLKELDWLKGEVPSDAVLELDRIENPGPAVVFRMRRPR